VVKRFRFLRDFAPTKQFFSTFSAGSPEFLAKLSIFDQSIDPRGEVT
jgi:hypothetical protein